MSTATGEAGTTYSNGGHTYPNFFDAHLPFQIDNFGGTAGMAEVLLQRHLDDIHLVPALPDAWKVGQVKGLKARGTFDLSIDWKNHQLSTASITLLKGSICHVRTNVPVKIGGVKRVSKSRCNYFITSFLTQQEKFYIITAVK